MTDLLITNAANTNRKLGRFFSKRKIGEFKRPYNSNIIRTVVAYVGTYIEIKRCLHYTLFRGHAFLGLLVILWILRNWQNE